MRILRAISVALVVVAAAPASAEVVQVAISTRQPVANGQAFGAAGPYEKLVGRITFAIDPKNARNTAIADLDLAPRGSDGRVHFSADLYVLQPVERARGNGALLFDVANRGRKVALGTFDGARASIDPSVRDDFGDGFLLREGYTIVWIGWQFDVAAPLLAIEAPHADLKGRPDRVRISFITDAAATEVSPADLPRYAPVSLQDPDATLTVRNRFWEAPTPIARGRWSFAPGSDRVRIRMDDGFEPGRVYEVAYRSLDAQVAGVGLAAMRDAASAFRYRDDLPVHGRTVYAFGLSQSGRFLRQFLVDGFNADEQGRRVFDAVWAHIAGAGLGSFNERFAMPGYSSFPATQFPYTDAEEARADGTRRGILSAYTAAQQPKVIYTNSAVEYWGQGRAAALTHTSIDGTADVPLPPNVRMYLLSGTQHGPSPFPPRTRSGQAADNPTPHAPVMRALLRAMHRWATDGTTPPDSRVPRLADGTLVPVARVGFPAVPGVRDPRTIEGPAQIVDGRTLPLPFLVPQVDADGNDLAGVRAVDIAVPLATTTGWNFRSPSVGNPTETYPLLGSFIPFAPSRQARESTRDPRKSVAERYRSREDYLNAVDAAAAALVKSGFLLEMDVPAARERALARWEYAVAPARTQ